MRRSLIPCPLLALPLALLLGLLAGPLPAAPAAAGEPCYDYAAPPESLILSTRALDVSLRDLAAGGPYVCWVEGTTGNQYSVLHWCEEAADGSLQERGTHRLQRDGADYACANLRIDGTRVIVYDSQGGWQIVDFADPAAPTVPWEAPAGSVQALPELRGDLVYAPTATGLALLELRAGQAPVLRSEVSSAPADAPETNHGLTRVALDGDYCWAMTMDGEYYGGEISLLLIACRDPDALEVVDRSAFGWTGDYDDEAIYALAADDGTAILTRRHRRWTGHPYEFETYYYIHLFSRDAGGHVTRTQSLPSVSAKEADIAGDRAWVSENSRVRYLVRDGGVWRTRDWIWSGMSGIVAMAVTDGAHVHAGGTNQAVVLAPSLPTPWPEVGLAYQPDRGSVVRLAAISGGLIAWVYGYSYTPVGMMGCGFVGLGTADPSFLTPTPLTEAYSMDTFTSDFVGDYAYTSSGIWNLVTRTCVNAGFPEIYDSTIFGASGSTLWGSSWGRLQSYDGSDPASPVLHGAYFPISGGGGYDRALFASTANLAFFANRDTLIATRLDAPHEPTVVDRLVTGLGNVRDLAFQDGRLFVGQDLGLALVDVAADGGLTLRGVMDGPDDGAAVVEPDGPVLYTLATAGGLLRGIDVSDPTQPRLIGEPGIAGGDLLLYGDVLYVVGSYVTAVRRQCADSVPVALANLLSVWHDGAANLTWSMAADLAAVRVQAQAAGRSWVVPWRREADGCRAVDAQAPRGRTVVYGIQILTDGQWLTFAETSLAVPAATLALAAPAPNPFNAATALAFSLDVGGPVEMTIVDAAGRVVRTLVRDVREAGDHTATWLGDDDRGRPVAAGTYFVRLVGPHGERVVKAALVK